MPANDPGSPKRGWRGGAGPAPKAGRPAAKGAREWTKKQDRTHEQAVLRHRLKVAAWSLLFLALTVVFVVWILSRPEPTPLLAAAAIDYDAPAPPNAWAKEDIEQLLSLRDEEVVSYPGQTADWSNIVWKDRESGKSKLKAQLDETIHQGAKLVIVYLSMHGVVDGENEPCLLPPGASPLDSSKWLKLRELLDYLFPKQAEKPKRALLVLDCSRIDVNWGLGVLYNGFAERLAAVVKEKQAEYPGLAVLSSASRGQVGWSAPELGGSVFGHFLWRGLSGEAYRSGKTGFFGRRAITLRDLHSYLRTVRGTVGSGKAGGRAGTDAPGEGRQRGFPRSLCPFARGVQPSAGQGSRPAMGRDCALWERHKELAAGAEPPWRSDPLGWRGSSTSCCDWSGLSRREKRTPASTTTRSARPTF